MLGAYLGNVAKGPEVLATSPPKSTSVRNSEPLSAPKAYGGAIICRGSSLYEQEQKQAENLVRFWLLHTVVVGEARRLHRGIT